MLTPAELATEMKCSARQVQRWTAAGMPFVPIGARDKRYDAADCKRWLRETYGCQSSQARPGVGTSASALIERAFTEGSRQVRLRALPSSSKQTSDQPSESASRPFLATPA